MVLGAAKINLIELDRRSHFPAWLFRAHSLLDYVLDFLGLLFVLQGYWHFVNWGRLTLLVAV